MLSNQSLVRPLLIASSLRTISAGPLPNSRQAKRSASPQNIGSGLAIAICIVFLAIVFYYLGMHHKRTKTWFLRCKAFATQEPAAEIQTSTAEKRHKRQISCPISVTSSAPITSHGDPVEAPAASLRCYELPIKEVYELGLPSPKKPPPRASWLSLDRKPWWLTQTEREAKVQSTRTGGSKSMHTWFRSDSIVSVPEEKSLRTWFRNNSCVSSTEENPPNPPPPIPDIALPETVQTIKDNGGERKSDGSTSMDWGGLDYMRKIYTERKSKIGL